ncbi:MAG: hypothetical protein M1152_06805 [Actinobacteria bacterium]|nr:hypothetical protein [Actinomycetota bacterium]
MTPQTKQSPTKQSPASRSLNENFSSSNRSDSDRYVLPIVGISVPAKIVEKGFLAALIGSVAFGTVDPPLGLLIGSSVLIARHRKIPNLINIFGSD